MNQPSMTMQHEQAGPSAVADELASARDDLARLSNLLNEAFAELLASFSAIQAAADGSGADIGRHTLRAVTALQCEDMASQLITYTQKRLESARSVLKNLPEMPQTPLRNAVWAAGLTACADLPVASDMPPTMAPSAPVRQDSMGAGDIDLF